MLLPIVEVSAVESQRCPLYRAVRCLEVYFNCRRNYLGRKCVSTFRMVPLTGLHCLTKELRPDVPVHSTVYQICYGNIVATQINIVRVTQEKPSKSLRESPQKETPRVTSQMSQDALHSMEGYQAIDNIDPQ